jgi:hypothetical protein
MSSAFSPLILLVAVVAESVLLWCIAFHQAGGWGSPTAAFLVFLALSALPLLLTALMARGSVNAGPDPPRNLASSLLPVSLSGVLFASGALAIYGHATPVLLLVGLVVQFVLAFTARAAQRHAT